ncbi:MAG: hypothetical protein ABIH41_05635 [Nanoarchaeota archaeon]
MFGLPHWFWLPHWLLAAGFVVNVVLIRREIETALKRGLIAPEFRDDLSSLMSESSLRGIGKPIVMLGLLAVASFVAPRPLQGSGSAIFWMTWSIFGCGFIWLAANRLLLFREVKQLVRDLSHPPV